MRTTGPLKLTPMILIPAVIITVADLEINAAMEEDPNDAVDLYVRQVDW